MNYELGSPDFLILNSDFRFPKVPGSIAERNVAKPQLDGRFERNRSAQAGHAQANRGEYLHVCYESQPKAEVVLIYPTISRLMNEETSK